MARHFVTYKIVDDSGSVVMSEVEVLGLEAVIEAEWPKIARVRLLEAMSAAKSEWCLRFGGKRR